MSSVWFGPKERSFSTSLGVLSLTLGNLIGFIIPAVWIKDGDAENMEVGKKKFENYMLFQCILVTLSAGLIIIISKEGPPTPPSSNS